MSSVFDSTPCGRAIEESADRYTYVTYPIGYTVQPDGRVVQPDGAEIDPNSLVSFEHRQIALERQARTHRNAK